jgi:hypothetical protein
MRKKRKNKTTLLISIMMIITFGLTIGYSYFTSELEVNGTINVVVNQPQLNNEIIKDKKGRYTVQSPAHPRLSFVSEALVNNTLTTTFSVKKKHKNVQNWKSVIKYVNKSNDVLTNGTYSMTTTCSNLVNNYLVLSSSEIAFNQEVTFTANLSHSTLNFGNCNITYTISYEVNGIKRYLYYIIKIL